MNGDAQGRAVKRAADSRAERVQIILNSHINGTGRLFGGILMEWIDVVAAVVARRHAGSDVTTASVDSLDFKAPAYLNDTVVLSGQIVYVGSTSMVVRVDTDVESLSGERRQVNRAYLTLVALDDLGRPRVVPKLLLETDEQREEWTRARDRRLKCAR